MKLKTKISLTAAALVLTAFSLAGCSDNRNDTSAGTGTDNTTTTTTATSGAVFDGEYEAGEDGVVNDNDEDNINGERNDGDYGADRHGNTDPFDDDTEGKDGIPGTSDSIVTAEPSDVTDNGIVPGTSDNDEHIVSDEAAFASSYISHTSLKNDKIGWGLGKERDSDNRPIDAVKAQEKYKSLGAEFIAPDGNIILTFDEGYENGYTASILDTLKEKDVKAVFFVTYDYVRTAPELVRRMIDEGHTVGNHTWSHPSMPDITQKQVWEEVTKLHEYVKKEFGYEMTLFRFPKGEFSERTLDDVHNLGYTSMFWSFAYADWDPDKQTDPAEALARIEDSTHSGIYLLHAVSSTNAKILGEVIDFWRGKGYTV